MKRYRKKIAMILVLSLTLAVAIPALAATTTKIKGKYEEPDIQVIIPTVGQAVINPYDLPVKVTADDGKTKFDTALAKQGQVATRPLVGVNLSNIPLDIGATVSAETTGDFRLSATAPAKADTSKSGQVYFQLTNAKVYSISFDTEADKATTVCGGFDGAKVIAGLNTWGAPAAYDKTTDLLLGRTADSKQGMTTLKAADFTDPENPVADREGFFVARLAGKVVQRPREEWVPADGFDATITWIIEPGEDTTTNP